MIRNRIIRHALIAGVITSFVTCPGFGFGKPRGYVKPERIDTADSEDLINRLGHQPELLRVEYLHYMLGNAEDGQANRINTSKHYIWYRKHHQGIKFELFQEVPQPGRIVESTFIMHTDDIDLNMEQVEKKFGKAPRKYFDQQAFPTEEYSFAPGTVTSFTQRQNSFQVSRMAVHYKGEGLPPPSPVDIAAASAARRNEGMAHFQAKRYQESMTVLREHLGEHPEDLEAHLTLARAYKANCQINEAIAQYRYTLQSAPGQSPIRTACIADLQAMKVLPSTPADQEEQKHNVNLKHKGQRLKRGSLKSKAPLDNPLGIQPIDPNAVVPRSVKPETPGITSGADDLNKMPEPPALIPPVQTPPTSQQDPF